MKKDNNLNFLSFSSHGTKKLSYNFPCVLTILCNSNYSVKGYVVLLFRLKRSQFCLLLTFWRRFHSSFQAANFLGNISLLVLAYPEKCDNTVVLLLNGLCLAVVWFVSSPHPTPSLVLIAQQTACWVACLCVSRCYTVFNYFVFI